MFAMLRRAFQYIDKETFTPLYKTLVRTRLDYASSVYSPYKLKHVDQLEAVQRRATKQLPGMKDKPSTDRLKELKLPTLSYRRLSWDMIEVNKIINGIHDKNATQFLKLWKDMAPRTGPRGNPKTVFTKRATNNLRKNSFTPRVAGIWNCLPENVVSAPSVNSFKNRLHKFWACEDSLYDYRAVITGSYKPIIDIDEFGTNRVSKPNAGLSLTWPLGTNFCEFGIKIQTFSYKRIYLKNVVPQMATMLFWPHYVDGNAIFMDSTFYVGNDALIYRCLVDVCAS